VLVKPDDPLEDIKKQYKSLAESGFKFADEQREKEFAAATQGQLVAVSPVAFTYTDWPHGSRIPQVGDRVAFGRYSGTSIKGKDGADYRLMKDQDIYAVVWDD